MSRNRIRTRTTRGGRRHYMVAYRLGGRHGLDRSAGTFHKLTQVRQRMQKVHEVIARGEHDQIQELANPAAAQPAPARSRTELHQQWIDGSTTSSPPRDAPTKTTAKRSPTRSQTATPLAFD